MLSIMRVVLQALPLVLVFGAALHASCADNAATGDTTSGNVTVSEPSNQACNNGAPNGYCEALAAVPESCECFDCVETAACTGACNDDGTCGAGEDCTCEDCYQPGSNCETPEPQGAGPSGDPGPTNGGSPSNGGSPPGSGGGPGAGGAPSNGGGPGAGGAPGNGGAGGA
jgi:hypothetical protein